MLNVMLTVHVWVTYFFFGGGHSGIVLISLHCSSAERFHPAVQSDSTQPFQSIPKGIQSSKTDHGGINYFSVHMTLQIAGVLEQLLASLIHHNN